MTEPRDDDQQPDARRPDAALDALLADPLLWEQPEPGIEDAVVASILAEQARLRDEAEAPATPRFTRPGTAIGRLGSTGMAEGWVRHANSRAWIRPFVAGAAAAAVALVLVVGGIALVGSDDGSDGGVQVALAGTELAPDASAEATVADTPLGTVIDLDLRGLAPAPDGTYYQAWLREEGDDGEQVSAGTFHLRGGDGRVELWAGVAPEQYPILTVTLQQEGEGPGSSGEVVLRGRVEP